MRLKLITCDVLTREVCYCIARSPHTISPEFLPLGRHDFPKELRALLQARIDAVEEEEAPYDALLLGYGICGNATVGLVARSIPLIIPRAHDCTTLLLGSRDAFAAHFGENPSQAWVSQGYHERSALGYADSSTRAHLGAGAAWEELVATYGEENAAYLMEQLHPAHESPDLPFIEVPETRIPEKTAAIEECAVKRQKRLKPLTGSIALIEAFLSGNWPEEDFLHVPPKHTITGEYDHRYVMGSRPEAEED